MHRRPAATSPPRSPFTVMSMSIDDTNCLSLLKAASAGGDEAKQFCAMSGYKQSMLRSRCLNRIWADFDELWMPTKAADNYWAELILEDMIAIISVDNLYTKQEEHVCPRDLFRESADDRAV